MSHSLLAVFLVVASPQVTSDDQVLWNAYFRSIYDSAVYQRSNVRELRPIRAEEDGNVLVAVVGPRDGNPGDTVTAGDGGIWVTGVPEVQTICRGFQDVPMQLRQLLGLPPDAYIPRVLILKVSAADLFRPSPDGTITTTYPCSTPDGTIPNDCGNAFPTTTTPAHFQWIATQTMRLHAVPNGYPWTHLGYTYNWAPSKDRYGASEYVILPKKTAVIVQKTTPAEYCAK